MLKSFFHTGFVVKDIEESIKFYTDVMGLKLQLRAERSGKFAQTVTGLEGAHLKIAFLNMGDGHNLELVQYMSPTGSQSQTNLNDMGASHLAFFVENIEKYYDTMSKKGLRFISAPATLVEDGKVVRKAAFCQDPDNNWLELVEVPQ